MTYLTNFQVDEVENNVSINNVIIKKGICNVISKCPLLLVYFRRRRVLYFLKFNVNNILLFLFSSLGLSFLVFLF